MITLATLKDATAQQVFDQVATHLLKQNEQSRSASGFACFYRNANGLMCAAGCLIADDEYRPEMDKGTSRGGGSWNSMVNQGTVPPDHRDLIARLQSLHDNVNPKLWINELRRVAEEEGLVFNHAG